MPVLQYAKWQNFKKIIDKAMVACKNSEISIKDCFTDISKPIISGKGKQESIEDYKLTRYACYLIAQNGDSRKKSLLLLKHISRFKLENKKLLKKNIVCLLKMKRDFIKET